MEKSVTGPQKTKNKNKKTTKKNKLVSKDIWSSHPLLGIRDLSEGNEVNMGGGGPQQNKKPIRKSDGLLSHGQTT